MGDPKPHVEITFRPKAQREAHWRFSRPIEDEARNQVLWINGGAGANDANDASRASLLK